VARKKDENQPQGEVKPLIAKKDWRILCGDFDKKKGTHEVDIQIKAGQDVGKLKLEEKFLAALKAEKVI